MGSDQGSKDQAWELELWRSPVRVLGDERVTGLELRDTRDSDVTERLECGLIVRSLGYSSVQADPQFLKLVNYNRDVFGEFYNKIIENKCLFKVEA